MKTIQLSCSHALFKYLIAQNDQGTLTNLTIMPSQMPRTDISYDSLPPWSCGVCTFVNQKSISKCRMCEIGERPAVYGSALIRQRSTVKQGSKRIGKTLAGETSTLHCPPNVSGNNIDVASIGAEVSLAKVDLPHSSSEPCFPKVWRCSINPVPTN